MRKIKQMKQIRKIKRSQNFKTPKISNSFRGKPKNLKQITINAPNIWTNDEDCIRLIGYLVKIGRHYCLHKAGRKSKFDDSEYEKEIQRLNPFYETLEKIAMDLFEHACETKRCLVFFFRQSNEEKVQNYYQHSDQLRDVNGQSAKILRLVQGLFSFNFYQEIIQILFFKGSINQLVDQLIQSSMISKNSSQIIRNIYIKFLLDTMKKENNFEAYKFKHQAQIESHFNNFMNSQYLRNELEEFVNEIKLLFKQETYQNQYQDSQSKLVLASLFNDQQNQPWDPTIFDIEFLQNI